MKRVVLCSLISVFALAFLIGIQALATKTAQAADKPPKLKKVFPRTISAGAQTFTVRVQGRHFAEGAQILFDGVALDSSRRSSGQALLAEVPDAAVAVPGEHTVQVQNPDGMTTVAETLTVVAPDPESIIRLLTNAVEQNGLFLMFPELRGTNLKDSTKVLVWGKGQNSVVQGDFAQFVIPGDFLTDPARIPIVVRDKKGNYSNTEIFFVVPTPPAINVLEPDSIDVGDEDFQLKVFGDYKPDATIVINGVEMPTGNDKKGRLITMVPASLRAQPAQLIVRVRQDGTESANSILTVTPTDDPFIYTVAPITIRVGEDRQTLDIVGANFGTDATALIDGVKAKVKDQKKRRITVVVPPELLTAPGSHTVQVLDRDGNPTDTRSFEVVPDVDVGTLIGSDHIGFNTDPCVAGEQALLRRPRRLNIGPDGLIYFTDQQNNAIRALNPATLEVCTVAGVLGEDGYNDSGNELDKPPTFSFPNGVAVSADGTIYVSENGNSVIRRIVRDAGGISVDTFAGTFRPVKPEQQKKLNSTKVGIEAFRDSTVLDSSFRLPDDMTIAIDGTIYIADALNHAIRRITQQGGQALVETVAGNGVPGFVDGFGSNARFNTPTAIALSPDEQSLFVADTNNGRVRRIDLVTGFVDTFAGSGSGNTDDGPPGEAGFFQPIGVAVDSDGTVYVSEIGGNDIRRIDVAGNVSTLAGGDNRKFRDGPGVSAKFAEPRGITIDRAQGVLYVADYENLRIRIIHLR